MPTPLPDETDLGRPVHVADEHHIDVTRTARYWTLGERAPKVWFVLHGYKQLARRFIRRFSALDDGSRLIVAPEGLSRFYVSAESGRHGAQSVVGATWMTREDRDHEIRDYVRYLDSLAERVLQGDEQVTVLGFSQGVATASRWVTYGKLRPTRLILWGDFLPPDLDMERAAASLGESELILVRGSQDGALSPDLGRTEQARLAEAGMRSRRISYEGGHDIHPETLVSLA